MKSIFISPLSKPYPVLLKSLLAKELKERGIYSLFIGHEKPSLQTLAVKMLIKGYGIVKGEREGNVVAEEEGIKLLKGLGTEKTGFIFRKGGENVIKNPPTSPKIVIDMGLFNELNEEEKKKTLVQLQMTLNTIRKFWWDGNLVIVDDFKLGKAVNVKKPQFEGKGIVLDPYGETVADEGIIRASEIFIIGGIVDKGRRLKMATKRLAEIRGYNFPRVKITLRGSTVGVPDEINKIAEIIIRVKEGEGLEEAIIKTQSKADKVARILYDVHRFGESVLEEELKWLNADKKVENLVKARLGNVRS